MLLSNEAWYYHLVQTINMRKTPQWPMNKIELYQSHIACEVYEEGQCGCKDKNSTTHLGPVVCVREEALLASKCTLRRHSVSHYLYHWGHIWWNLSSWWAQGLLSSIRGRCSSTTTITHCAGHPRDLAEGRYYLRATFKTAWNFKFYQLTARQ